MLDIKDSRYFLIPILTILIIHFSYAQSDSLIAKVYFPVNSFSITKSYADTLQSFINHYEDHHKITIIGRSDRHGDLALNDDLSFKRAMAVKNFLLRNGFPEGNIALVAGLGKRDLIEPGSPYADSLNRVVWITAPHHLEQTRGTTTEVTAYSLRDSLILIFPPYPPDYLTLHQSPQKGDTLRIDTTLTQWGNTLFVFRKLYIAEDLSRQKTTDPILAYSIRDSLVKVLPPYPPEYLTPDQWPQKGDILRIDTTLTRIGDTLLIARVLYIAEDGMKPDEPLERKEIPRRTKKADLAGAFMDTLLNSRAGQAIIIRDLTFEFGYHVMPRTNLPALQAVSSALEKMPKLKLEIRGHVCCVEPELDAFDTQTSRYDLSVNRAKEIYDFLVAGGVDKTRISFVGYGMEQPLVYPEKDKDDQYKNRRIEFVILAK